MVVHGLLFIYPNRRQQAALPCQALESCCNKAPDPGTDDKLGEERPSDNESKSKSLFSNQVVELFTQGQAILTTGGCHDAMELLP